MSTRIEFGCPEDVLAEVQLSATGLGEFARRSAASARFRDGRLSSGLAARWLGMPRMEFLRAAMAEGGSLGGEGEVELEREMSLP